MVMEAQRVKQQFNFYWKGFALAQAGKREECDQPQAQLEVPQAGLVARFSFQI